MTRNHYVFDEKGSTALPAFDTLVIGGGGFKGCLFLGAMHYLEELGMMKHVTTFCGTSVGSVISLLCILGYSAKEQMEKLPINKVYEFQKEPPYVINIVQSALKSFLDETVTFEQLFKQTGKFFFVVAFDMTVAESKVFSVITTPNESVIKAVIFSSALPSLDMPVDSDGHRFIDGGVTNNLPIDIADAFDASDNILTLTIQAKNSKMSVVNAIFNAIFSTPSSILDEYRIRDCVKKTHVIRFPSFKGLEQLLSLTEESKSAMFDSGYETAAFEIKKFALK